MDSSFTTTFVTSEIFSRNSSFAVAALAISTVATAYILMGSSAFMNSSFSITFEAKLLLLCLISRNPSLALTGIAISTIATADILMGTSTFMDSS